MSRVYSGKGLGMNTAATTARWVACMEAGTHVPSRQLTVHRFIGDIPRQLHICATCAVPFLPKVLSSWKKYRDTEDRCSR